MLAKYPSRYGGDRRPAPSADQIYKGIFFSVIAGKSYAKRYDDTKAIHIALQKDDRPAVFFQHYVRHCKFSPLRVKPFCDVFFIVTAKVEVNLISHKASKSSHKDSKRDVHVRGVSENSSHY